MRLCIKVAIPYHVGLPKKKDACRRPVLYFHALRIQLLEFKSLARGRLFDLAHLPHVITIVED